MRHVILEYGVGENTSNPTGFVPTSNWAKASSKHMTKIAWVIKEYVKYDVEIISLPYSVAQAWLEENWHTVDTLSASVGTFFNPEWLSKYKDKIYMAVSSGNEGKDQVGALALTDYFTSIGACDEQGNPLYFTSYTQGKFDVDYVHVGKYTLNGQTFQGTSYSTPRHATEVLNLIGDFYTTYGRKPRIDEIRASIDSYAKDVYNIGRDDKTGKGMYTHEKGKLVMEFKDHDKISEWALSAVNKAKVLGILKGDENGNVNPQYPISMEQLMVILDRIGLLGK